MYIICNDCGDYYTDDRNISLEEFFDRHASCDLIEPMGG